MREKDSRCLELQEALDKFNSEAKPLIMPGVNVGTQVDCEERLSPLSPSFRSQDILAHATKHRTQHTAPITAAAAAATASLLKRRNSGSMTKRPSSRDRMMSPRRQSYRSPSPRRNSGDLDHEMREAGFDIDNSLEGVTGVDVNRPDVSKLASDSDCIFDTEEQTIKSGRSDIANNILTGVESPTQSWERIEEREEEKGVKNDSGSDRLGREIDYDLVPADGGGEKILKAMEGQEGQQLLSHQLLAGGDGHRQQDQPGGRDEESVTFGSVEFAHGSGGELLVGSSHGGGSGLGSEQGIIYICGGAPFTNWYGSLLPAIHTVYTRHMYASVGMYLILSPLLSCMWLHIPSLSLLWSWSLVSQ